MAFASTVPNAARSSARFDPQSLCPPPVFARCVRTVLLRPEIRRAILDEARQGRPRDGFLEVVGLAPPSACGALDLILRRNGDPHQDLVLGAISWRAPQRWSRLSRQLRLEATMLVRLAAASEAEILARRPDQGLNTPAFGMNCLDLRLLLARSEREPMTAAL